MKTALQCWRAVLSVAAGVGWVGGCWAVEPFGTGAGQSPAVGPPVVASADGFGFLLAVQVPPASDLLLLFSAVAVLSYCVYRKSKVGVG